MLNFLASRLTRLKLWVCLKLYARWPRSGIFNKVCMKSGHACVLYVDMLGFSALTEGHPDVFVTRVDGDFETTAMTPSSAQFNRFHRILEQYVVRRSLDGADRAMIFSDCAFLVFPNALLAATHSVELMRNFLVERVPVRMGLGHGTCHAVRFTSDTIDKFSLTRAMFSGTAIVRSSEAEKKGGKGCRIFVHPSLTDQVGFIEQSVPVLVLPLPSEFAQWELCYLHDHHSPAIPGRSAADLDLDLLSSVEIMRRQNQEPIDPKVATQYTDTFAALNRMRLKLSRPLMDLPEESI